MRSLAWNSVISATLLMVVAGSADAHGRIACLNSAKIKFTHEVRADAEGQPIDGAGNRVFLASTDPSVNTTTPDDQTIPLGKSYKRWLPDDPSGMILEFGDS